jgi:hypothetical protein
MEEQSQRDDERKDAASTLRTRRPTGLLSGFEQKEEAILGFFDG